MSDPSLPLQGALVALLKPIALAAGARVYDRVPENYSFPYVAFGSSDAAPTDEDCFDATETLLQIDVWSDGVGFPEVKRIAGVLRAALHDQPLVIEGHVCDRMSVRTIVTSRDANGLWSRARIELLVVTQPSA
jgi:hypothetical protein